MKQLALLFFLFVASVLFGQWSSDLAVNNVLASGTGDQECNLYLDMPANYSVTEIASGTVISWQDKRSGEYDIYAQLINKFGYFLWGTDGVVVCGDSGNQRFPNVIADNDGGVLVIWHDDAGADTDIYAQKVASDGTLVWASKKPIETSSYDQNYPSACSDGNGGAYIAWAEGHTDWDIYAQRMDGDGNLLWGSANVVCDAVLNQLFPVVVADGFGNALLAWQDDRSTFYLKDIYAQKLSSGGTKLWTASGVQVASASKDQTDPIITPDGTGGMYATWNDDSLRSYDIYVQRVYSDGSDWPDGPVHVAESATEDYWPALDNNGSHGVYVAWWANAGSDDDTARVAYLNNDGDIIFSTVAATQYVDDKTTPSISCDENGDAYVCWVDYRPYDKNIWGQKFDTSGNRLWDTVGIPFSTNTINQFDPFIHINDSGVPICFWHTGNVGYRDIYFQALSASGEPPIVVSDAVLIEGEYVYEEAGVNLDFTDLTGSDDVSVQLIWGLAPGISGAELANPAGVWWQIEAGSGITGFITDIAFDYSAFLGSMDESRLKLFFNNGGGWTEYPNTFIDTANNLIIALGTTHFSDWTFGEDEEPTLPITLSSFNGIFTTDLFVQIAWIVESETNHAGYNVLRGDSNLLADALQINSALLNQGSALGSQRTYLFNDFEVTLGSSYFYWLESVSLSGETEFFGPIEVFTTQNPIDPEDVVVPVSTRLLGASPNPFNPNTVISYYLKDAHPVKIEIFNMKGQVIRSFFRDHSYPGRFQINWDGLDNTGHEVGSGVYSYRFTAGSVSQTKRMSLMK